MPRSITATYRLQLTHAFPFTAVRELVPYFERLGVSHLYLSPVLAARPGSPHGYDVIDHARVNAELGTEDELRALAADLHARGMGIILDIVPNHMAASADNRWWDDVLERGAASRYAEWFDIDWDAPHASGKLVLPMLGDELDAVLQRGELRLRIRDSGSRVAYFERTFPLDPATLPTEVALAQWDPAGRPAADDWSGGDQGRERFRALLDAQHYRLTHWRRAREEINYRRFFDINDLVGLRMESDAVFDATHRLILTWVRDGVLDGLRVDHVDGLRIPSWYLAKLRDAVDSAKHESAPAPFPIFVEKLLSGDETLPSEWPVDGSTGYDFLNDTEDLFLDPGGFKSIEANYRGLRHNPELDFRAVARAGKRQALDEALLPDVMRVARLARAWCGGSIAPTLEDVVAAVTELIVETDVYRTYVSEPGIVRNEDRRVLADALANARAQGQVSESALALLERAFLAPPNAGDTVRAELVTRLQQISGPAAAKGVEDTALYVYVPLACRNEVGGMPDRRLQDAQAVAHARNGARLLSWPRALLATNTHDTKRSADLRARLDVLTTRADDWARFVSRWRKLNKPRKRTVRGRPAPDTNSEYLYYQTLLGLWPAPRPERRADDLPDREWLARTADRLSTFVLKAAREAKIRTSWTDADTQYEKALDAFVRESLEPNADAPFLSDVARLTAQVADDGFRCALARIVLHCTAPGVPDVYQGDELWNFTLVDPDNRRPVDFGLREQLLGERRLDDALHDALTGAIPLSDGRVKLALTTRLLRFRREHASLFRDGEYLPLSAGYDIFAFARRLNRDVCITLARTRPSEPGTDKRARDDRLQLADELVGGWRSVLTGRNVELVRGSGGVVSSADDLIPVKQPCELLFRAT